MNKLTNILLLATWLLSSLPAVAQEKGDATTTSQVEMADAFRADGKIYVVVAIVIIVLAGLFVYLFLMDRKLKRLEDQLSGK